MFKDKIFSATEVLIGTPPLLKESNPHQTFLSLPLQTSLEIAHKSLLKLKYTDWKNR